MMATQSPLNQLMQSFAMELDVDAIRKVSELVAIPLRERVTAVFTSGKNIHGFMTLWGGNQSTGYLLVEPIRMPKPLQVYTTPEPTPRKKATFTHCMKVVYATEKIAKQRLREIRENGLRRDDMPIRYYKCQKCGGYHLTKKESWNKSTSLSKSQ